MTSSLIPLYATYVRKVIFLRLTSSELIKAKRLELKQRIIEDRKTLSGEKQDFTSMSNLSSEHKVVDKKNN